MAVTVDTTASGNGSAGTTLTIPITVASHDGRVLIVCLATDDSSPTFPSSVTFNGDALTELGAAGSSNNPLLADIWYIVDPDVGTFNVVITKESGIPTAASVISLYGAETPNYSNGGTADGATSSSLGATASKAGMVIDCIISSSGSPSADGSQTAFGAANNFSGTKDYSSSYKSVSAGSPTMDWTFSSSDYVHGLVFVPDGGTAYTKSLDEVATIVDTITKTTSRALTEVATMVDTIIRIPGKVLTEVSTIVDTITTVRIFNKNLTEFFTISDGFGSAGRFDGVNDYVLAPSGYYPNNTNFSIEFWYKHTATSVSLNRILDNQDAGPANGFSLMQDSGDILSFEVNNGMTKTADLTTPVLTVGEKYHFVFTLSGGSLKMYINGALSSSDGSTVMTTPSQRFCLGRRVVSSTRYCQFDVDELRIYGLALSPTQISEHYQGKFADETSLELYWDFNEVSGTDILDKSGNDRIGTILPNTSTGMQLTASFIGKGGTYASGVFLTTFKNLAEAATIVDTVGIVGTFIRSFDETLTIEDVFTKTTTKVLTEVVELVDSVAKTLSRALDEAVTIVASVANIAGKVLSETATLVDTLTRTAGKALTETVTLADHVSVFLNGILQGLWAKTARITSLWSSVVRKVSDWTKIDRE